MAFIRDYDTVRGTGISVGDVGGYPRTPVSPVGRRGTMLYSTLMYTCITVLRALLYAMLNERRATSPKPKIRNPSSSYHGTTST